MFKFKPDNIYKKYNFLISKYVEAMRTNIIDYMEKDFNKLDKFFIKNEKYLPMEVQKYHHKLAFLHYEKTIPAFLSANIDVAHYEDKKNYHKSIYNQKSLV